MLVFQNDLKLISCLRNSFNNFHKNYNYFIVYGRHIFHGRLLISSLLHHSILLMQLQCPILLKLAKKSTNVYPTLIQAFADNFFIRAFHLS